MVTATTHPTPCDGRGLKIAVVRSRFNEPVTARLLEGALEALRASGVAESDVTVLEVPGAVELAFAARLAAEKLGVDAVVCLGAVIRGETYHFEIVANESASGLMQVQLDSGVPVANGILTADTEEQARKRAAQKGRDCAEVAVEMANLARNVAKSHR
jgi:6,7-dimethyl-8-ribityllumazine synthase